MDLKTYMYFYVQQCVQTVTGEECWQNIDFGAFNFCHLVRCSSLHVDAETLKAYLVDQNTCTDSTFTCMHSTQLASVPQWKLNLYNKGVFLLKHQRLTEDFMSQRGQFESVSSILYSRLWIEKEQCYIAILEVFCDHCSKPALLKKILSYTVQRGPVCGVCHQCGHNIIAIASFYPEQELNICIQLLENVVLANPDPWFKFAVTPAEIGMHYL